MLSLGLDIPSVAARGGSPYSAEANAFFARLATPPSAARKTQYDTLAKALVAAGVWAKLDGLFVFAAADQSTALTNLVRAGSATAVNSPTFITDGGFTGGSTKYIDSGFNASTAGGHFTQNDSSNFAWGLKTGQDQGATFGSANGVNNYEITPRFNDDNTYIGANTSAEDQFATTDGSGLFSVSRTTSTNFTLFKNGVSLGLKGRPSAALINANFTFMRISTFYYTGTQVLAGYGAGLDATANAALYAALHAYLQAVAGIA